jgi:hypothetical protein
MGPGSGFVVGGVGLEAAVEDADEVAMTSDACWPAGPDGFAAAGGLLLLGQSVLTGDAAPALL